MEKIKLAFVCQKGLESFIEPIVQRFERMDEYQTRRYYVQTQQEVIAAVKWADRVFLEWANETAIVATQIYDLRKCGVIVRLHSYEALSAMPTQIDWSVVDYLTFVAPHIREIVKRQIPDIEDRVCTNIIPNGVDIDNIEMNKVHYMYDVAYVANISHKKAPELALQVMSNLTEYSTAFKLHVAGAFQDERYKIYLEHMAKEMDIEDNIIYYGYVHDMDSFWQGKGSILSTSIHEGHPMNIIEGAARGLRPVVHNFYGAGDLYPDNWLYNTVNEAAKCIIDDNNISCQHYRDYVVNEGWMLDEQVRRYKKLIDGLADKDEPNGA